jgi:hypothetical protein
MDFRFASTHSLSKRAFARIDRPAPSNCSAAANRNASSLLPSEGQIALGFVVALVGELAAQPDDRPACDGSALEPSRLVGDLDVRLF